MRADQEAAWWVVRAVSDKSVEEAVERSVMALSALSLKYIIFVGNRFNMMP